MRLLRISDKPRSSEVVAHRRQTALFRLGVLEENGERMERMARSSESDLRQLFLLPRKILDEVAADRRQAVFLGLGVLEKEGELFERRSESYCKKRITKCRLYLIFLWNNRHPQRRSYFQPRDDGVEIWLCLDPIALRQGL
ncbi:MAG: hypothetical protein WA624_13660 [Methylocella sp.]